MVHLERKGWLWGWWLLFPNLNVLFFVDKKHRQNGKSTGKTGNLVLIGAWQPCYCWLIGVSLVIEMVGPEDFGIGEGSLWHFLIMRPTLLQ